jgi:excisionase family DNA binding protein
MERDANDPAPDLHAFTYAEVAERLGVSGQTVYRMVRAGHLRAVSVWGRPRVTAGELRRYLARLEQPLSLGGKRRACARPGGACGRRTAPAAV